MIRFGIDWLVCWAKVGWVGGVGAVVGVEVGVEVAMFVSGHISDHTWID